VENKKRILVTGGAGFIGANLCRVLLDKDYHVICVDNFYSGQEENITSFLLNKNFEMVNQNINEQPFDFHVDLIINLACPASPKFYQKDPIYTIDTNVLGVKNVLELAKKNNCVIFQASTSEVYGNSNVNPQIESYWGNVNPNGIRSCYDEGKRIAESLFMNYHRSYKTKIKIARFFNSYGPGMRSDDGRVISNFIYQALNNKDITIYGDGTQTRSFCYINDLIDGIIKFIEIDDKITGPINIGNPQEMEILKIAEMIIELTNSSSKIVHKALPDDDPKCRCPDISLAKKILYWEPKVNIKEGLIKTIEYFKNKIFN
jgi:UDP-glucuronate decarboxylase